MVTLTLLISGALLLAVAASFGIAYWTVSCRIKQRRYLLCRTWKSLRWFDDRMRILVIIGFPLFLSGLVLNRSTLLSIVLTCVAYGVYLVVRVAAGWETRLIVCWPALGYVLALTCFMLGGGLG